MKFRHLLIILFISSLFFIGFISSTDRKIIESEPIRASVRSFTIEVNTIGELDAAGAHMVSSTLQGTEARIISLADDGAKVKKGEVLVKLDKTPYEEERLVLMGELKKFKAAESARDQLLQWEKSQLEKELETADYKIEKAQIEYGKYINGEGPLMLAQLQEEVEKIRLKKEKLFNYLNDLARLKTQGFDYPSEIYKAEQEMASMDENLKGALRKLNSYKDHIYPSMSREYQAAIEYARMQKEQTKKAGVHKLAQAGSSLDEVRAAVEHISSKLKKAETQIQKTEILAPSDGIVILYETFRSGQKRKPRIGDNVLSTQPILYLPDISSMIVKTKIREVDLHKVEIGQTCSVFVDAYPDKKLEGKVSFIGALASDALGGNSGAKYFRIIVEILTADPGLRPGMTARVNIVTRTVHNALTIPLYCVFEDDRGFYCLKQAFRGKVQRVSVKTGDHNENFMVILSGLEEGDVISPVPLGSR